MIELTVPFERNIESAIQRKCDRYASLIAGIEQSGFKGTVHNYDSIEIGSRGIIAHGTSRILSTITKASRKQIKMFMKDLAHTVLKCSYLIFRERDNGSFTFDFTLD